MRAAAFDTVLFLFLPGKPHFANPVTGKLWICVWASKDNRDNLVKLGEHFAAFRLDVFSSNLGFPNLLFGDRRRVKDEVICNILPGFFSPWNGNLPTNLMTGVASSVFAVASDG